MKTIKTTILFLLLLLPGGFALAQTGGGCYAGTVIAPPQPFGLGQPSPGAIVRVCSPTATGSICSPLTPGGVFSDPGLLNPISNPFTADQNGNYNFCASQGNYLVQTFPQPGATYSFQVTVGIAPSGSYTFSGNNIFTGTNQFSGIELSDTLCTGALSGFSVLCATSAGPEVSINGGGFLFMPTIAGDIGGTPSAPTITSTHITGGTVNTVPKFNATGNIVPSACTDNGSTVACTEPISSTGGVSGTTGTFTGNASVGGTASLNGGGSLAGTFTGNPTFSGVVSFTGSGPGGSGTAAGGSLNVQKPAASGAIFMGRFVDAFGDTNNQLISGNDEQMVNPTSSVSYQNSAHTMELFTPNGNTQNFTGAQVATDSAWIHYGSGSLTLGAGLIGEAWNSGPATSIIEMDGVSGGCHNGSVTAGIPPQTPTGNGSVTNCRGIKGGVTNSSSGTITAAEGVHIDSATNTGGGTITANTGLFINDQTVGGTNFAIKTGLGLVSLGDATTVNSTLRTTGNVGIGGTAPLTAIGVAVNPTALTSTTQTGMFVFPSTTSAATTEGDGIAVRADVAASTTQVTNVGLHINTPNIGGSGAITNWNGLRIEKAPTVGTLACSFLLAGSTSGTTCFNPAAAASGTITLPAATGTVSVIAGNCSSSASPAVCGSASAGSFVVAAGATTVTVNTTAVTANSQIFIQPDDSLGTKLSVTCNTTAALLSAEPWVGARTAATSFAVNLTAAPTTNPECLSYFIVN